MSTVTDLDDEGRLVEAARSGDQRALERLHRELLAARRDVAMPAA